MIAGLPTDVLLGVAACVLAVVLALVAVLDPGRRHLPLSRRRPGSLDSGVLARSTTSLTAQLDGLLSRRDVGLHIAVLDRAGVHAPLARVALFVGAGSVVAFVAGLAVSGLALGFALGVAVPVAVRLLLGLRAGRRRHAFVDQLEDSLQLLASSLRAGQSLPQALAAVARDIEEPSREEFSRIVNETRVGRDVGVALTETAERMQSPDLAWVSEAIAINREVGGNLAEVLDRVIATIRDRHQLRRQVATLSAEGRLSAYILLALPFVITGALAVVNPTYLAKFTASAVGYGLIGLSVLLMLLGSLWLSKIVRLQV